jgi:phosphate transport system substrate-binding protein
VGTRRRGRLGSAAALLLGLAGIGLTAACGTAATAGTSAAHAAGAATGTIAEDGSGLLEPMMQIWAMTYNQRTPGVTVTYAGGGSSKGIKDASAGTVQIGGSDAYLSAGDLQKNGNLLNIPLVVSAQSVIYYLPGLKPAGMHVRLSGTVLADMYSGIITTWNDSRITDLNPGITIPPLPVVPVERSDGSGDTFLFTSYLSTQDKDWSNSVGYGTQVTWPPTAVGAKSEKGALAMITTCAANPGCVGYNGVSYLGREQPQLDEAMLQSGSGGWVLPDAQSIQDEVSRFIAITPPNETIAMIANTTGAGYPIVNYEYAIVSRRQPNAAQAARLRNFLNWVVTTGNESTFVDQVNFQPLPSDLQKLSRTQIGEIH